MLKILKIFHDRKSYFIKEQLVIALQFIILFCTEDWYCFIHVMNGSSARQCDLFQLFEL